MGCFLHSGILLPFSRLQYTAVLLVFSYAGLLHAQGPLSANGQGAAEGDGMDFPGSAAASAPGAGFNTGPSAPGLTGGAPGRPSSGTMLWNHLLLNAFQMGMHASNSSGSAGGNHFGAAPRGNPADLDSLFHMVNDLSHDLGAGKKGILGTVPNALSKFDLLRHGGLNLPLNSSLGNFRLSYQNFIGQGSGGTGEKIGRGSPSASFASSHLHSGKADFSATAAISEGSMGCGSCMSAGISSFGGQAGGGMNGGQAGGSMGGQNGGPDEGRGGGPVGGNRGGQHPAASLSLHLSF
jgi:hypothetical protein